MASTVSSKSRRPSTAGRKGSRPTPPTPPTLHRKSTVSRWGNSLGVRIPQEAAARLKLEAGAAVTVEVSEDSITIKPLREAKKWSESELLKGVTPEAVGGEVDWGDARGREVW